MKIRTRLALQFTLIVASLLIVFATSIYYFSAIHRQKEFYERLNEKAKNYGKLIIEVQELDENLIKIIDKNTSYLPNERILLFDEKQNLLFNTNDDDISISKTFLTKVKLEKEIKNKNGKDELLAILYPFKNELFTIIVSAYDKDGLSKLHNLKIILIVGLLACVMVTMLAGWIYSGQALRPISGVVRQVEQKTVSNLTEKVHEGNGKDEISHLAKTFNRMLERIQQSFEMQKSFVSNSSHELRTPLTSITGQLEVALLNDREPNEYKTILHSILEDIKSVNSLTNGLLELAQADMDVSRLQLKKMRVDELLWNARNDLMKRKPDYKIHVDVQDFPENEANLIVLGSEHLLRSAFINLMDNGCKFSSDKAVKIIFKVIGETVNINFIDKGIGISKDDIQRINEPFYRGTNAKSFPGHGLGMSLTSKIIALHNGKLSIASELGKYTEVKLKLKIFDEFYQQNLIN